MVRGKFFNLSIIVIVLICAVVGLITRYSFYTKIDIGKNFDQTSRYFISIEDDPNQFFDNNINDYQQLEEKSDLIVRIRPTSERTLYNQALLSRVKVTQVYKKHNNVSENEDIYIFEPSFFHSDNYITLQGYNIMLPDTEYFLFLKKIKAPSGYHYSDREAITYLPVSTLYGKYFVDKRSNTKTIDPVAIESESTTFFDIKDYDILTQDKKILETYYSLQQQVISHLSNVKRDVQ